MAGDLVTWLLQGRTRVKALEAGLVEVKALIRAERGARSNELEAMRARAEEAEAEVERQRGTVWWVVAVLRDVQSKYDICDLDYYSGYAKGGIDLVLKALGVEQDDAHE